jgi:phage-related protein
LKKRKGSEELALKKETISQKLFRALISFKFKHTTKLVESKILRGICRILFTVCQEMMVLLHGFVKKS